MKRSSHIKLWLFATALGTLSLTAQAADLQAGKNVVEMRCQNCHALNGIATLPGAANLAGQQDEYLRRQLKAYRSGERQDPVMGVVAKMLTDEDIAKVADTVHAWRSDGEVETPYEDV
ncbi:MAG: cytochrome c, partial [Actinobacteria bacterium]|nr:cytochrome c [Actinomycetota bacterium]